MNLFFVLSIIAMLLVFALDIRTKRRSHS